MTLIEYLGERLVHLVVTTWVLTLLVNLLNVLAPSGYVVECAWLQVILKGFLLT